MKDEAKPREWVLRIHSNNDGGGYLYSGSDVRYPEDDYLEVVEKKAFDWLAAENQRLKKIIAKELSENDELGSEFTYVTILKEENRRLREALEKLSKPASLTECKRIAAVALWREEEW